MVSPNTKTRKSGVTKERNCGAGDFRVKRKETKHERSEVFGFTQYDNKKSGSDEEGEVFDFI